MLFFCKEGRSLLGLRARLGNEQFLTMIARVSINIALIWFWIEPVCRSIARSIPDCACLLGNCVCLVWNCAGIYENCADYDQDCVSLSQDCVPQKSEAQKRKCRNVTLCFCTSFSNFNTSLETVL